MTNQPRPFGSNMRLNRELFVKQGQTQYKTKFHFCITGQAFQTLFNWLIHLCYLYVHPAQPVIVSPNASRSSCLFSAACLGHHQTSQRTPGGQLNQAHSREEIEWL